MVFTEIKERGKKKYYYRVLSFREKGKVSKKRVYLGADLIESELKLKESNADEQLRDFCKKRILVKLKPMIKKIVKILKKNSIKRAGIFGSYARGEQKKNSDVDILVELGKPMGFDFVGIQFELEDELGKKVDLVTYNSLHPLLKDRILNEETKIL
jgi:predicted nucleotidyltransferase